MMASAPSSALESSTGRPRAPSLPDRSLGANRLWVGIGMAAIVALGGLLRFFHITAVPLSWDEPYTWALARQPLHSILGNASKYETNPPLFYALQHLWLSFGDGEFAMRFLPAVFGTLTIPLIFALGKRLGGIRVGLIAALLLATSPLHVQYGQYSRGYTLLSFGIVLSSLGMSFLIGDDDSERDKPNRWPWVCYIAGTTIVLYGHNTGVLFWLIVNLIALAWTCKQWPVRKRFYLRWMAANITVLILWSLWLPKLIWQIRFAHNVDWIQQPTLQYTAQVLWNVFGPIGLPSFLSPFAGALFAAIVLLGIVAWRTKPWALVICLALGLGMPALVCLISLFKPILIQRILVWCTIFSILLLAAGIGTLRQAIVRNLILAAIVLMQLIGVRDYYLHAPTIPYDQAANIIITQAQPGDAIVYCPYWFWMPIYYHGRDRIAALPGYGWSTDPIQRNAYLHDVEPLPAGQIQSLLTTHRRLWLVWDRRYAQDEISSLEHRHEIVQQWYFPRITLCLANLTPSS